MRSEVDERFSNQSAKTLSNIKERRFSNVEERRFSAALSSKKIRTLAQATTAPPQFVTPAFHSDPFIWAGCNDPALAAPCFTHRQVLPPL